MCALYLCLYNINTHFWDVVSCKYSQHSSVRDSRSAGSVLLKLYSSLCIQQVIMSSYEMQREYVQNEFSTTSFVVWRCCKNLRQELTIIKIANTPGIKQMCVSILGGGVTRGVGITKWQCCVTTLKWLFHAKCTPGCVTHLWMGSSAGFNGLTAHKGRWDHVAQQGRPHWKH